MLYKYASWQEKDKNDITRKNIKDSALYFNTPDSFNDPFDNAPSYNISVESRRELINRFVQDNRGKCSDDLLDEAHNIPASEFNTLFKDNDFNKLYTAKRGITCLSRDNANILMWSHYANKHSGVCLGFDIDENDEHLINFFDETRNQKFFPNGKACRLFPMTYVAFDERPSIDMNDENKSWTEILTFKSDLWKYEQEVRIMVHSYDQIIFPRTLHYKPDCLKEIICGANMKLKTFIDLKNFIDKLSNAKNISISVATLSDSAYKLLIKKLDSESLEMISKNYLGLCSPDEIFTHSGISELKEIYKIGKRKIKKDWNESLDNLLIHRVISDFKFNEMKIAEMLKQGGNAPANICSSQDITLSLFLDTMTNNVKYLLSPLK